MEGNLNARINNTIKAKISISILLFLLFSYIIIMQMFFNIKHLQKYYNNIPIETFKKLYLYKDLFNLFKLFSCIFMALDILIIYIDSFEIYSLNIFDYNIQTFLYFNYFFFGPILFGVVILCMKYGNELTFLYDTKTLNTIALDFKNIFIIFLYIFVSFSVTMISPIYYSYIFFINSIKFKRFGDFLLGTIFWKFALYFSDGIGLRLNNNIGNPGVQNEQQNIQNNIMLFDGENPFLLPNFEDA